MSASLRSLICTAALAASACASAPVCADLSLPEGASELDQRAADLDCVGRWIALERSWPAGAQAEAYLALAALVARADNGHSNVTVGSAYTKFGLAPIRTGWFADGLHVVRAAPDHAELVGARVVAIEGRSPAELGEQMGAYVGGTEAFFWAYFHPVYLLSPALLHAAGVGHSPDTLELELDGDRQLSLPVYAPPEDQAQPWASPWRYLNPEPLWGEGEAGWVAVFDDEATLPWAYAEPQLPFRYRYDAELDLAQVQWRTNVDRGEHTVAAFLRELDRQLERDQPGHLIWDNRQNGGGDLTLTADYASGLPAKLPEGASIYSLVGPATFSAGIYTAMLPASAGQTLVVGEHPGDRPSFWAETGPALVLPHARIRLNYALERHDLGAGCHDPICHIRKPAWNVALGELEPDVEVETKAAQIFAGRDPQREWVVAQLSG